MSFAAHVPSPGEIARYISMQVPTGYPGMDANSETLPRSSSLSRTPVQYSLTISCAGDAATPIGPGTEANGVGACTRIPDSFPSIREAVAPPAIPRKSATAPIVMPMRSFIVVLSSPQWHGPGSRAISRTSVLTDYPARIDPFQDGGTPALGSRRGRCAHGDRDRASAEPRRGLRLEPRQRHGLVRAHQRGLLEQGEAARSRLADRLRSGVPREAARLRLRGEGARAGRAVRDGDRRGPVPDGDHLLVGGHRERWDQDVASQPWPAAGLLARDRAVARPRHAARQQEGSAPPQNCPRAISSRPSDRLCLGWRSWKGAPSPPLRRSESWSSI